MIRAMQKDATVVMEVDSDSDGYNEVYSEKIAAR